MTRWLKNKNIHQIFIITRFILLKKRKYINKIESPCAELDQRINYGLLNAEYSHITLILVLHAIYHCYYNSINIIGIFH